MKDTILSGLRVNSELHLGHYLGVVLPLIRLANEKSSEMSVNLFIPDLHSIISPVEGVMSENIIRNLKIFLAAGLKVNENVHFYRQSRISAHAELCWVLNCTATMGELGRMTQYKDKGRGEKSTNVGIFDYPVLMAADILLYSARYVPVGEDQFQHIELARNLGERFNKRYGEVFVLPEESAKQAEFLYGKRAEAGSDGRPRGVRIRDLVNPEKKMSKSTASDKTKIMLSDSPDVARKKILSATTDSFSEVKFDFSERPGISNLLSILALCSGESLEKVRARWEGETRYGELKKVVGDAVAEVLDKLQQRVAEISDEEVLDLLPKGEEYARGVAEKKLKEVYKAVGLL